MLWSQDSWETGVGVGLRKGNCLYPGVSPHLYAPLPQEVGGPWLCISGLYSCSLLAWVRNSLFA